MKVGVVVFPGSNCDHDCRHVAENVVGMEVGWLWHRDDCLDPDLECVVLPGGFTYGDYLRAGAIAHTSPIMGAVKQFAARGGKVIGICNGFQILTESGLLPGALLHNACVRFLCKTVPVSVERRIRTWTDFDQRILRIPIAHGQGNYFIEPEGLERLEKNGQILFRYCESDGTASPKGNPNGSIGNIAGIVNETGNVLGMMPHPERCAEPELGNEDGRLIWESLKRSLTA